jgi:hypothetical protein
MFTQHEQARYSEKLPRSLFPFYLYIEKTVEFFIFEYCSGRFILSYKVVGME